MQNDPCSLLVAPVAQAAKIGDSRQWGFFQFLESFAVSAVLEPCSQRQDCHADSQNHAISCKGDPCESYTELILMGCHLLEIGRWRHAPPPPPKMSQQSPHLPILQTLVPFPPPSDPTPKTLLQHSPDLIPHNLKAAKKVFIIRASISQKPGLDSKLHKSGLERICKRRRRRTTALPKP